MKTVEHDCMPCERDSPCDEERRCLPSMTKPTGHERSGRAPVSDRSSLSLRVAHSRFRDKPAASSNTAKDGKGRGVHLLCLPISFLTRADSSKYPPLTVTHRRVVRWGDNYSASDSCRAFAPKASDKKVPANSPRAAPAGSTEHWPFSCRTGCEVAYHHLRGVCHG